MSRSVRHQPICSILKRGVRHSEKADKQIANRCVRRVVATLLRGAEPPEVLPEKRELSEVWTWRKDGKRYWRVGEGKAWRFGSDAWIRELMRK